MYLVTARLTGPTSVWSDTAAEILPALAAGWPTGDTLLEHTHVAGAEDGLGLVAFVNAETLADAEGDTRVAVEEALRHCPTGVFWSLRSCEVELSSLSFELVVNNPVLGYPSES
jgi:hypothetical protein